MLGGEAIFEREDPSRGQPCQSGRDRAVRDRRARNVTAAVQVQDRTLVGRSCGQPLAADRVVVDRLDLDAARAQPYERVGRSEQTAGAPR
jgi:hypothetical protein